MSQAREHQLKLEISVNNSTNPTTTQLKSKINLLTAAMLSAFAAMNESGAALRMQVDSESHGSTDTGGLVQYAQAVVDKVTTTIEMIAVVREEINPEGVQGQNLQLYDKYLKDVAAYIVDNNLKVAFLAMLPHLDSSEVFFDDFLHGVSNELTGLKTLAGLNYTLVSQLASQGAGAFMASEDNGHDSPCYLHRQMMAGHHDMVNALASLEELLNAVIAAEKGKPFMGVTYKSDIGDGDDTGRAEQTALAT